MSEKKKKYDVNSSDKEDHKNECKIILDKNEKLRIIKLKRIPKIKMKHLKFKRIEEVNINEQINNNFKIESKSKQNMLKTIDDEYKKDEANYYNERYNHDSKGMQKEKLSKKSFLIKSKNRKRISTQEYVEYILEKEKIICLGQELYKYDWKKGYYKPLNQHEFGVLMYQYIKEDHKRLIVDYDIGAMYRILKVQPQIQVDINDIDNNDMLINCKNCLIDLERNRIYKHSPNRILFNSINAEFIKDLEKEEFKLSNFNKFINSITNKDKELKKLIQEIFGYSISSMNKAKKFFLFNGVSNSGKSTIIDLLNYIVGEENCSHIPLQKLIDDKYCAELFGKLLNTYNELPDEGLRDLGQIKALVSDNDKITARRLYGAPFSFKNKSTLIFSCNNLPEIKNKLYQDNSALFKRLIIIPFLISIPEDEQDKDLFQKLIKEKNLIFRWSLIGLQRFIENNFIFSNCKISNEFLKGYIEEEDLIGYFINENITYSEDGYLFWDEVKAKFKLVAKENGKSFIEAKEIKFLKKSIENRFGVIAKKLHRDNYNKLGFNNIGLKQN